jgi:transposase
MTKDILNMSLKEADRLMVLGAVVKREVTQVRAAEILDLSVRQVRRLAGRIKEGGAEGVIHRSRGKRSPRKLSEEKAAEIIEVVRNRYWDFGPTLAAEKLSEYEGIQISSEKLRQLMLEAGIWKRARRRKKIHTWRERKAHCGEMVQLDGSHHDWLEGRGPKIVLMGYIDDATSRCFGRFYDYEGVYPAMDSLERYIRRYGRPVSLYMDKHSTYKTTREPSLDELLRGESAATQVERACREVGIKVIHADSPQAKGRVERSFKTHQDRLVKGMRLEGVSSLDQANEYLDSYLPNHNQKFSVQPFSDKDLHRGLPSGIKYRDIFCLKDNRTITNGFTIKWKNRLLLIENPSSIMRRQQVEMREHFDGEIEILFKSRRLKYRDITEKENKPKINQPKKAEPKRKGKYIPPSNHPWRRWDPALHNNCYLEKIGQ